MQGFRICWAQLSNTINKETDKSCATKLSNGDHFIAGDIPKENTGEVKVQGEEKFVEGKLPKSSSDSSIRRKLFARGKGRKKSADDCRTITESSNKVVQAPCRGLVAMTTVVVIATVPSLLSEMEAVTLG